MSVYVSMSVIDTTFVTMLLTGTIACASETLYVYYCISMIKLFSLVVVSIIKCSIVHIKQFIPWRREGVAFEFKHADYSQPNRTISSAYEVLRVSAVRIIIIQ